VPITVNIVQLDAVGRAAVVGGFVLAPGASVDVQVQTRSALTDEIHLNVLRGRVPVHVQGVSRIIEAGEPATMTIDKALPKVSLVSPAGGERVISGRPYEIKWSSADQAPAASIDVSFSSDGGLTYDPIASCTGLPANTVSCSWQAPGPSSSQARIRVTARDLAGHAVDVDSESFTVALGDQPVAVAAAGAVAEWAIGSRQRINWTFGKSSNRDARAGTEQRVSIDVSRDEGVTWEPVADGLTSEAEGTGTFEWEVTGPPAGAARVRVRPAGSVADVDAGQVTIAIVAAGQ
jgi:hypothetical protein